MSEWGNPLEQTSSTHAPIHNAWEGTRGTETSKYPEEEKETFDSVSSGERTRKSPNRDACIAGFGLHKGFSNGRRTALEQPAREGESPVSEARADPAGSRVPRDTGNPVGTSGDHSVRLNTTQ